MSEKIKIIIAGGGTGGHVFPAIAVARSLQKKVKELELLFVGAKGKMEMEKVPEAGYSIIGLRIAGMNRSSWLKNITLPMKVIRSLFQARKIVKRFRPQVVLGVGGYASFPVLNVAQSMGIPTVITEQNAFSGKTNKILGKKASKICVATKGMEVFYPKNRIVVTGNPVREEIIRGRASRAEALTAFGLEEDKKTLLVVGGSLGAGSVNAALIGGLDLLLKENIQMIWQTGKPTYKVVKEAVENKGDSVKIHAFITKMELAYAAADVIVSRAGALAVSELSVVGKPVIFVPYPYAAEDHQTENVKSLLKIDAALMVRDEDVNDQLVPEIIRLLNNEGLQKKLGKNIKKRAITNAADRIAEEILKLT